MHASRRDVADDEIPLCDLQRDLVPPGSGDPEDLKKPTGVSSAAPMTIVTQPSGAGSIPFRRAPMPVASSSAAKATFHASQS